MRNDVVPNCADRFAGQDTTACRTKEGGAEKVFRREGRRSPAFFPSLFAGWQIQMLAFGMKRD